MSRLQTALALAAIFLAYGFAGRSDYEIATALATEQERDAALALAERATEVAQTYRAACWQSAHLDAPPH